MTDVSSKGLIPQLTDVMRALTDAHELLLLRVQTLRREHHSAIHVVIDNPLRLAPPSKLPARPQALVDAAIRGSNGAHHAPRDFGGRTNESDKASASNEGTSNAHDAGPVDYDDRAAKIESESSSPSLPTIGNVTGDSDAVLPAPASTPPQPRVGADFDGGDVGSANRNYNFFDELDAQLTYIQDPGLGSEERDST